MNNSDRIRGVQGLLFIGDPHLEARVPGFRKDDYPSVALEKFRWCLAHAQQHHLQPILLGDLFQLPQDNPNWLVSEIIDSIGQPLPAIYGNHDVRENSLKPNDTINILFSGGQLKQLSADQPLHVSIEGKSVLVGGSAWGQRIPYDYPPDPTAALTVWITHHDLSIPGYEESGRIRPRDLSGIDLIVNGHIHRRLTPVCKGSTHWVNAGNIVRRARSDASREHTPAVVTLRPAKSPSTEAAECDTTIVEAYPFRSRRGDAWNLQWEQVPHLPFDDVFHPQMEVDEAEAEQGSSFVADLRELTARRTDSGAGLTAFLQQHLGQFETAVANEIMRLHDEVAQSSEPTDPTPTDKATS